MDLSGLSLNESIHLSQLKLPAGVELLALAKEDSAVVAIHSPRAEEPEAVAAAAEGATAAPAAAAAGADAKKAEPAKADAKERLRRKTPRSNVFRRRWGGGRRQGGPFLFLTFREVG